MPTHAERRILPHAPEQLFDLVADIEAYPQFLPWCRAARITNRYENVVVADLIIGFKLVRERFTSHVTLFRPGEIKVEYTRGPLRYLNNHWVFEPHPEGCVVDFYIDFEFRSRTLQKLIGVLFNEAVQRMVRAFETRADEVYGSGRGGRAAPQSTNTMGNAAAR
ncbi:MAG: type II toxin-antitoxin system RatA family toxin [Rhodospirillaceae bacterium]|nr:type II toxin-antitoxin system RatA family toxin [Rhodospirillaceae bacterium]